MSDRVLAQIATLPTKEMQELKDLWRELLDTEPPAYNKTYLVRRLAYRIQELAYGGLLAQTVARLDALADEEEERVKGRGRRNISDRPIAGTRLIREWRGVDHCVTVLTDGFEYQGRKFRSLSAAARAITGTQWSGPLFFGLRRTGRKA